MDMYDLCDSVVGIDTLRIRLMNPYRKKGKLKPHHILDFVRSFSNVFNNHPTIDKPYFNETTRRWELKDIDSGRSFCRFYGDQNLKYDRDTIFVELYGMYQCYDGGIFKLSKNHADVLKTISCKPFYEITIEKVEFCLDYYFDFFRSFVFSGIETKENRLTEIKKQNSRPKLFLNRFPSQIVGVPIEHYKTIQPLLKGRRINPYNPITARTESHYRYRRPKKKQYPSSPEIQFETCEFEECTHIVMSVKNKDLYYDLCNIIDPIDKKEIITKMGRLKQTTINYDKVYDPNEIVHQSYQRLIKTYSNIEDQYSTEFKELEDSWKHSRVEVRRYFNSLELDDPKSYITLKKEIKEQIEKIRIFILKPEASINGYFIKFKKLNKGRERELPFIPIEGEKYPKMLEESKDYGRIIDVNWNNWNSLDNQLDVLKSFFIKK